MPDKAIKARMAEIEERHLRSPPPSSMITWSDVIFKIIMSIAVLVTLVLSAYTSIRANETYNNGLRGRAVICERLEQQGEVESNSGCFQEEVRVLWDESYDPN